MSNKTELKLVKKDSNEIVFHESTQKGKKILCENDFFKDFINLMHNIEFNNFYKKYFQNWSDIETMIFYMKLYKAIEYGYSTKFSDEINAELMTFTLHRVMTTSHLRKKAIQIFRNFKESSKTDKEIFNQLLDFENLSNEKMLIQN
jgi:hypothetical protein